MKHLVKFILILLLAPTLSAQDSYLEATIDKKATLSVFIEDMYPFAYYKNDSITGIEVDILNSFVDWLEIRKGIQLEINFKAYNEFNKLYKDVIESDYALGAASITINKERANEIQFTPSYLKNNTVLVSHNSIPSIKSYSEISSVFKDKVALVIEGTTFEKELQEIKAFHFPQMRVKYVKNTDEMLPLLTKDSHYYTIIDLVTFWDFVKNEKEPLKAHRIATGKKEEFGFILPKKSDWSAPFDEFFNSGFGFTSSEDYYDILKKHLGVEVLNKVAKN